MAKYAAIDPGISSPGIAIVDNDMVLNLGQLKTSSHKRKGENDGMTLGRRLKSLSHQLDVAFGGMFYPDFLVVEYPMPPGRRSIKSTATTGLSAAWLARQLEPRDLRFAYPATWMRGKKGTKMAAAAKAIERLGKYDLWLHENTDAWTALTILNETWPGVLRKVKAVSLRT